MLLLLLGAFARKERRAARGIDAAYEASARAAEAEAAEWDARAAATRVFLRIAAAETQRVLRAATDQFANSAANDGRMHARCDPDASVLCVPGVPCPLRRLGIRDCAQRGHGPKRCVPRG